MGQNKSFTDIELSSLVSTAERLKREGWRCVQMLCVNTDAGVDMTYTFAKDEDLANYQLRGVTGDVTVPSIQNLFLGIFPFENEAVDLFGVHIEGMVLDFAGQFYAVAEREPMTILTPEAKERRDKEAKKAAAAEAKAKKADAGTAGADGADLEAKLAGMDPEKAAKVRAAMEAKAKKAAADAGSAKEDAPAPKTADEIEAKIAGLDPEKAAKVRAALEAKAKKQASKEGGE